MITYEDICKIMGTEPTEIIKCDDGLVMSFGGKDIDLFEEFDKGDYYYED